MSCSYSSVNHSSVKIFSTNNHADQLPYFASFLRASRARQIQPVFQNSPFHSVSATGSELTGVLANKWLAAPKNDLVRLGRILT